MIEVVAASPAHVRPIANRLREIDKLEAAIFGRSPRQAVRWSFMASTLVWTVRINGRPEAMMGASAISTLEGRGSPWLLMTDEAVRHARALVVLGRQYSAVMLNHFPVLENACHADNAVAIRWLKAIGYDIGDIELVNGHPMRSFSACAFQPSPSP